MVHMIAKPFINLATFYWRFPCTRYCTSFQGHLAKDKPLPLCPRWDSPFPHCLRRSSFPGLPSLVFCTAAQVLAPCERIWSLGFKCHLCISNTHILNLQSKFTDPNPGFQKECCINPLIFAIRTAMTKDCKPGDLTAIYCLKFWGRKCLEQDVSRLGPPKHSEKYIFHASPLVPVCLLAIFGVSWCEAEPPALFIHLQVVLCVHVYVQIPAFYKHASHTGLGTHHTPVWFHLN